MNLVQEPIHAQLLQPEEPSSVEAFNVSHGRCTMAAKAECADIIEVALSTALQHGLNVIGIP
jgi:hypothetical protein